MKYLVVFLTAWLCTASTAHADTKSNALGNKTLSLREALKRDFGLDLPIVADEQGAGGQNSPISIIASDPAEIGITAYQTVGGIHQGLSLAIREEGPGDQVVGAMWRSLDEGLQFSDETGLYKYRLDRKILTSKQVIDETIAYYFDLPELDHDAPTTFPKPVGAFFPVIGLTLPAEIGWLKYDASQAIDYAAQKGRPDLGVGVAYGALGIKATVYVYPTPANPTSSVMQVHFEEAAREVEESYPVETAWPDRQTNDHGIIRIGPVGDGSQATALAMSSTQNQLVKIRTTWFRDESLDTAVSEFIMTVLNMVSE